MAINERVRNIIFDLGGVLVGLDGQRCMEAFCRLGCPEVADYVRLHRTEDLFYRIELGLISTREFCNEIRLMTGTTATDEALVQAWCDLLLPLSPQRADALRTLRQQGYRLFLLSNTNDMHWQYCRHRLFPADVVSLFSRVYLSYEMQLAKPQPEIFCRVLDEAGLQAAETLFVDDNADNIAAASALGIGTFLNHHLDEWTTALLR